MILTSLMTHALALRIAARRAGAQAHVDLGAFGLTVQATGKAPSTWHPRFLARLGERLAYTDEPGPATIGFAGWLPYRMRRWPEASDKFAFKAAAHRHGVATPAACLAPDAIGGPFLVKPRHGSFGRGQRGPFPVHDGADVQQQLGPGEYYENYVVGLIAKAWCWAGDCVALELQRPPTVVGDGTSTLRDLVRLRADTAGPPEWEAVTRLATLQGLQGLDGAVPAGREVLVDYRYGSRSAEGHRACRNRLEDVRASGLSAQFEDAARRLQACIPAAMSPALYTLDAVVDADGQALFLEMNCNPLVHPQAYAAIVASVVGVPGEKAASRDGPVDLWEQVASL